MRQPAIEINDFSCNYHDGTVGLSNVNLTIEEGRKVALIGPNGAGKSTLLLAMAGFITGSGKILIDGIQVNKKNLKKIRTILGICFENPDDQLFMPTLFDDIAFGLLNMGIDSEEVKRRVADSLRTAGLSTMAQKSGHHLSAGQKRSAAMATVLTMNPKIIVLDEPDGALDPANRKKLTALLSQLTQTLVIATCDMNFAASVAEVAVLIDDGRVIAAGCSKEIMSDEKLMTAHGLEKPPIISFDS